MRQFRRWFDRMDDKRVQERRTVQALVDQLGLNRASYYEYRRNPAAYPRSEDVIGRIAEYLSEDTASLEAEMRPGATAPHVGFLAAAERGEYGVSLYQEHVRSLHHVLGLGWERDVEQWSSPHGVDAGGPPPPRRSGVDVVVRLLREWLPRPNDPFDVCVVVRPTARGFRSQYGTSTFRSKAWEPYQYQIYVIPECLADGKQIPAAEAAQLLERLQRKVGDVLAGTLLSVTREPSAELALPVFAGKADLLLYPGLLEMRPPAFPSSQTMTFDGDILVTGVYYSGAPDVAAILARTTGYGFATFDHLARLQVRAGLSGLPSHALNIATCRTAVAALREGAPTGSMVWATDNPETLLVDNVAAALDTFSGRVVLLMVTERLLIFAAYHLCRVNDRTPSRDAHRLWVERLRRQQRELYALLGSRAITYEIDLPGSVSARSDGSYPDEVDELFDRYVDAANRFHTKLSNVR